VFVKPLIFSTEWANSISRKFFKAYEGLTDYGACCIISPYLHFINPETRDKTAETLEYNLLHNVPRGVKNGLENGLKLVLDVDAFDYAYDQSRASGFKVALTNSLDVALINQDGFYISPGVNFINVFRPRFSYKFLAPSQRN
jgi:hypothetical protein